MVKYFHYRDNDRRNIYKFDGPLKSKRCISRLKNGSQCKKHCVIGYESCYCHTLKDKHLKIKTSGYLLGQGLGLYAENPSGVNIINPLLSTRSRIVYKPVFANGTIITQYNGETMSSHEIGARYGGRQGAGGTGPYVLKFDNNHYIDCALLRGIASNINGANEARHANCEFVSRTDFVNRVAVRTINVVAIKDIDHDTELLAYYGQNYRHTGSNSTNSRKLHLDNDEIIVLNGKPYRGSLRNRIINGGKTRKKKRR